jgi:hypothetical protein
MLILLRCLFLSLLLASNACVFTPLDNDYSGPQARPISFDNYYSVGSSYSDFVGYEVTRNESYIVRRFDLESDLGHMRVDLFDTGSGGEDVVLVFPVLGGRNIFSNYMAHYFAERGIDSVVVHRDSAFKKIENYIRLEEILRENVVKDRIIMDFLEREFGKKNFGGFGISRGAINLAITAGVDSRLKYNVLAIGGADLINLFRDSEERGIERYRRDVKLMYNLTEDEFYSTLEEQIRTDPKYIAPFMDARNTLLFLSVFDTSVPVKYGIKLKRRIGHPETVFLLSGHYTTLLYTQFVHLVPPSKPICFFPLDYIESESLHFFRKSFKSDERDSLTHLFFDVIQAPVRVITNVINLFD